MSVTGSVLEKRSTHALLPSPPAYIHAMPSPLEAIILTPWEEVGVHGKVDSARDFLVSIVARTLPRPASSNAHVTFKPKDNTISLPTLLRTKWRYDERGYKR